MNLESLQFLEIASRGGAPVLFDKVVEKSIRSAEEEERQASAIISHTQNQFLPLRPQPNPNFGQLELDKRHVELLRAEQEGMQINFQDHFEGYRKERARLGELSNKINLLTDAMGKIAGQLDNVPITLSSIMAESAIGVREKK